LRYIEQTQFPAPEEAYGVDILPAMRFSVYNLTKAFDTWATLPALQPDVEFDTSVGYYTAPGANILTSPPNNWTITYY